MSDESMLKDERMLKEWGPFKQGYQDYDWGIVWQDRTWRRVVRVIRHDDGAIVAEALLSITPSDDTAASIATAMLAAYMKGMNEGHTQGCSDARRAVAEALGVPTEAEYTALKRRMDELMEDLARGAMTRTSIH